MISPTHQKETKERPDWLIGRVLGKYRLVKLIGSGAFASVYEAMHIHLHVPFAIKVLHMTFINHEEVVKRFFREAQAASQLQHQNVVFIADFDMEEDVGPYIVMEYLEGDTLRQRLDREGSFSLDMIGGISRQICQVLAVAHKKGVIHRDLKPENISLVPREMGRILVKILDFGIAHLSQCSDSITGARLIGTPVYMAPEQFRGVANAASLDIYSFGVILYEMLTGKPPYRGKNVQQLGIEHMLMPVPTLGKNFSEELASLLHKILAKNPKERPSSMEEVWALLAKAIDPSKRFADWHKNEHLILAKQTQIVPTALPEKLSASQGLSSADTQESEWISSNDELEEEQLEKLSGSKKEDAAFQSPNDTLRPDNPEGVLQESVLAEQTGSELDTLTPDDPESIAFIAFDESEMRLESVTLDEFDPLTKETSDPKTVQAKDSDLELILRPIREGGSDVSFDLDDDVLLALDDSLLFVEAESESLQETKKAEVDEVVFKEEDSSATQTNTPTLSQLSFEKTSEQGLISDEDFPESSTKVTPTSDALMQAKAIIKAGLEKVNETSKQPVFSSNAKPTEKMSLLPIGTEPFPEQRTRIAAPPADLIAEAKRRAYTSDPGLPMPPVIVAQQVEDPFALDDSEKTRRQESLFSEESSSEAAKSTSRTGERKKVIIDFFVERLNAFFQGTSKKEKWILSAVWLGVLLAVVGVVFLIVAEWSRPPVPAPEKVKPRSSLRQTRGTSLAFVPKVLNTKMQVKIFSERG